MKIESIGRYRIVRELAPGEVSALYEARDPITDRRVHVAAVFRAKLDAEAYANYLQGFRRHLRVAGRLSHAGIVPAYEAGEVDGIAYLATAPTPPETLKSAMRDSVPWEVSDAIRVVSELAGTLDFVHRHGIVHRDVKPAGIVLEADGAVRLTDFSAAKFLRPADPVEREEDDLMVGTPAYMSPEQVIGKPLDGRSDLFSAGIVLYMLLTGKRPFPGDGAWRIAKSILQDTPVTPSVLNSRVPPGCDAVVMKALAKDPGERYASGRDFAVALGSAVGVEGSGVDPAFIGRYRIDSRIEARGPEVRYVGFDTRLLRSVLIRALSRATLDDESYAQAVAEQRTAAQAVARLSHPGVLQIHDSGESDGFAYLAMERFPGNRLGASLEEGARFEPARAATVVQGLLDTLSHVHQAGILHRNIHAGSVLLGDKDETRLTDFDLARLPFRDGDRLFESESSIVSGKVAAMAPEQILGLEYDERSEIFQVGVLLYRMLTGRPAFAGPGAWTRAKKILQENPVAPSQIDSAIPPGFDSVIAVALEKAPERRFASATRFAGALRSALDGRLQEMAAHHIVWAAFEIGDAGPEGKPWGDEAYRETGAMSQELPQILRQHGAGLGKVIGNEFFACFSRGEGVVPALQACLGHLRSSSVAVRYAIRFKALVHHGLVISSDGDAFGDDLGLAASMFAACPPAGVYFSAPAVAAFPVADRSVLRLSGVSFERFTRNPKICDLVRSPLVHELA